MSGAVTIGRLIFDLAADIGQLKADMTTATNVVEGACNQIDKATSTAKSALIGLAAALGPLAFLSMIQSTDEATAALGRMSEKTGYTVEALSALRSAAKLTNTDFDAV